MFPTEYYVNIEQTKVQFNFDDTLGAPSELSSHAATFHGFMKMPPHTSSNRKQTIYMQFSLSIW